MSKKKDVEIPVEQVVVYRKTDTSTPTNLKSDIPETFSSLPDLNADEIEAMLTGYGFDVRPEKNEAIVNNGLDDAKPKPAE